MVTLNDLERRNGRYFALFQRIRVASGAHCVKVHVRYLILWWVLVILVGDNETTPMTWRICDHRGYQSSSEWKNIGLYRCCCRGRFKLVKCGFVFICPIKSSVFLHSKLRKGWQIWARHSYAVRHLLPAASNGPATQLNTMWHTPVDRRARRFLWPPFVADADIIFLPCGFLFYLLLSFFPRRRRLDVYHTQGVGLSANLGCIQVWNVLRTARWNTGRKKSPKIRHLRTIAQLCWAISSQLRHISTIGKIS